MILSDLREFLETIPAEFNEYELMNGEVGYFDPEDLKSAVYRLDKPIIMAYVDQETKEVCFFHQTREEVNDIFKENDDDDNT